MSNGKRAHLRALLAACLLLASAGAFAHAQAPSADGRLGVRAGVADDPDQILLGAHYDFGFVWERFRLVPSLELGFGDDADQLTLGVPLHWEIEITNRAVPYVGAGLLIGVIDAERASGDEDTELEIGAELTAGIAWPLSRRNEVFAELNFQSGDFNDLQLVVGVVFGAR